MAIGHMDKIDLKDPDAYSTHLAEVNTENDVIATEDIRNSQGALIVPKGTKLAKNVASKIIQHKLVKPLESSVKLEKTLGHEQLFQACKDFINPYEDLKAIHDTEQLDELLEEFCRHYATHEILVQKLTVMEKQLNRYYKKGLFCCWFSMVIAKKEGLQTHEIETAFLAGLAHDMGLLHIEPEIAEKNGNYTPEEWRAMQSHVLIGQMIIKNCESLPDLLGDAIAQHHERCDGAGYPFGLTASKLNQIGQIVAMTDSLYPMRFERFADENRQLADYIPILQFNQTTYFQETYRATALAIRESGVVHQYKPNKDNIKVFTENLLKEVNVLKCSCSVVGKITQKLPESSSIRPVKIANNMLESMWDSLRASGLLTDGIMRWIGFVGKHKTDTAFIEMDEISLMHRELTWQIQQFSHQIDLMIDHKNAKQEIKNLDLIVTLNKILNVTVKGGLLKDIDPDKIDINEIIGVAA